MLFWLPGSMVFLFGVAGVLIARTNPIDPDGKDLTATWWGIGIGALVLGGALLAAVALVPKISKKRQRLDSLPEIPHQFASWHVRTVRQGPVAHKYHVVVAATADRTYVANNVIGAFQSDMAAASADGKLPHIFEEGMVRGLRRHTTSFTAAEVQAVGVRGNSISLITSTGVEQIVVSSNAEPIGAHLASLLVADCQTTQFTPESAGLVSKKVKERGPHWTLHQPAGVDLASALDA